ncbi:Tyrosine-protein phosphatase Lar [Eumeta japonica]|uniref:Tyrosine-protein phosphatase Lar n=1 Tax=Eumeta variegata TaxID=151549 RepID=A0A4C1XR22_EUMVA|nr:Tyrosine-protein phosphatase Lar [Eumeta japonica]
MNTPERDPPEITIRPRNLQVRANGIAAFYCAARGDPIPTIQWRKNGKRVSSMQSRYQVSDMGTVAGPAASGAVLRIEPVRAQRDDATYECVAENGVGDAVTAVATLTVFEGRFRLLISTSTRYNSGVEPGWTGAAAAGAPNELRAHKPAAAGRQRNPAEITAHRTGPFNK